MLVVCQDHATVGYYYKNKDVEDKHFAEYIDYRLLFHPLSLMYKLRDMLNNIPPTTSPLLDDRTNVRENLFLRNLLPCIAESMGVTRMPISGELVDIAPELRPRRLLEHLEAVITGQKGYTTHKFRFLVLYALYKESTLRSIFSEMCDRDRLHYFYKLLSRMWRPANRNHSLLHQINDDNAFTAVKLIVENFCFFYITRPRISAAVDLTGNNSGGAA